MGYRKRQTMTDPSGVTTYTYDPQTDRLVSKQTPFGTIAYTYDAAGDVTQIASSNASGSVVAYQYDKLNRLSTVTVPGQSPTNYSYDAVGNLAGYPYPTVCRLPHNNPKAPAFAWKITPQRNPVNPAFSKLPPNLLITGNM
jgi:YD repeat-containing protein